MTQATLGERLAQNISEERSNTRAAQERAAGHASEQARRDYETVAQFFEDAKQTIEEHILAGRPSKDLRIQVGRSGSFAQRVDDHANVYSLIEGWNYRNDMPITLSGNGKFSSLWSEFCAWGASQQLEPVFRYEHDGVGMHSWWALVVRPAGPSSASARNESPAQRRERVLQQTLKAYVELAGAITALPFRAASIADLDKHRLLLAEASQLLATQAKA